MIWNNTYPKPMYDHKRERKERREGERLKRKDPREDIAEIRIFEFVLPARTKLEF